MNHPYMDPNDCPWTDEYKENKPWLYPIDDNHSRYWCDENEDEYEDSLFNVI